MKKFALALTAAAAVVLGSAGIADAGTSAYPPGGIKVTAPTAPVTAGGAVSVSAACTLGETVTFALEGQTATAPCNVAPVAGAAVAAGQATGSVNAPTTAGTYTGTITGSISGALGTFTVTVAGATTGTPTTPAGGLPATGSDGTQTMTMVAGGILLAGLGMFGVATARRRQDAAAA